MDFLFSYFPSIFRFTKYSQSSSPKYFNVFQCVSMRFNVFHCVSMCFNVFQCISMYFNVLVFGFCFLIKSYKRQRKEKDHDRKKAQSRSRLSLLKHTYINQCRRSRLISRRKAKSKPVPRAAAWGREEQRARKEALSKEREKATSAWERKHARARELIVGVI